MKKFNDIVGQRYTLEQLTKGEFNEFIHQYNQKPVFSGEYKLFHNKEYFIFTKSKYWEGNFEVLLTFTDKDYNIIK